MVKPLNNTKVKTRCPECGHYIFGTAKEDGTIACICSNCKSVVISKEHKGKEKLIKIKYID